MLSSIYSVVIIVSSLIMASLAAYALLQKRLQGARYFAFSMLTAALYSIASVREGMTEEYAGKLFWRNVQWSALDVVFLFIFFFILNYVGKHKLLKPARTLPFYLLSAVWVILIWTDERHHLLRDKISLVNGKLIIVSSALDFVFTLYIFTIIALSLFILGAYIRSAHPKLRGQAVHITIGVSIPAAVDLVKILFPKVAPYLMPTAVFYVITGLVIFRSLYKHKLLSIVPIARDKIVETMKEGILVIDGQGNVIDYNETAGKLLACIKPEKRDPMGEAVGDWLSSWPEWRKACEDMNRAEFEIEATLSGEIRNFTVNIYPLYTEVTRKMGAVSVLIDITFNRKREQKLKELNQLKDNLFAVVSHDIRNPLADLVSLTELLEKEKPSLSADSGEIIDEVKDQVANTYTMVETLLEWFRSQRAGMLLNPAELELSVAVRDAIEILRVKAEVKNIAVKENVQEGIRVSADRESLELIVRNLVSNAIKFTPSGGELRISAEEKEHAVVVSFRDSGVGIQPEQAQKLLSGEHFVSSMGTSGEKGTGLGLLICKELVHNNGGEFGLESVPGRGSTFYFSLPKARLRANEDRSGR